MLFDGALTSGLYTVGFLVGIALPGWRSLAVVGVAATGLAVYASVSASSGDGVASALAFAIVMIGLFGLACGIVTRAVTFLVAPLGRRPYSFLALVVVGYVLGPIVHAGPKASLRWLTRPSLASCRAAAYPVRIADQVLHVPGAPIFSVFVPRGPPGDSRGRHFGFFNEPSLREICDLVLRDGATIGPAFLSLRPPELADRLTGAWTRTTCASPRGERDTLLCRPARDDHVARRLERALIYGEELAAATVREYTYKAEQEIAAWSLAGRPLDPGSYVQDGPFEVRANGLRLARGPDWTRSSDVPLGVICSDGPNMLCAGITRLDRELLTRFTVRTTPQRLEADVRGVVGYLNEFVRVLAARP